MVTEFLINKVYADSQLNGGSSSGGSVSFTNPLGGVSTFNQLVNLVIKDFIQYIAPSVVVLMVLYGAFQILTAAGEPERFATGRRTILYAIILVAWGLVTVIQSALSGGS